MCFFKWKNWNGKNSYPNGVDYSIATDVESVRVVRILVDCKLIGAALWGIETAIELGSIILSGKGGDFTVRGNVGVL